MTRTVAVDYPILRRYFILSREGISLKIAATLGGTATGEATYAVEFAEIGGEWGYICQHKSDLRLAES